MLGNITEKQKMIAAVVIGALALLALGNLIFAPFSGSKKRVTVNVSPTPSPTAGRGGGDTVTPLPAQSEIDRYNSTVPVAAVYAPPAPEAGRNIFAFYEPPAPTPWSPTPTPEIPVKTPPVVVEPTPNVSVTYLSRQSVYAGEKGFRLEIGGDKFTPETYVYFNGNQMPTNFISPQQLSVDVPANFIAGEGQRQIVVQTPDRKLFSNPLLFNVQAPPRPQFQYIGIVSRKRGNNDTAYIQENSSQPPVSKRLNDVIGGRFRLVSIAPTRLMVQDINLGFMHPVELFKGTGQTSSSTRPNSPFPNDGNIYQPYNPNPNVPNPNVQNPNCPPGIPCGQIPRYVPTPQPNPNSPQKQDVDDDDEDGDNR